MGSLVATLPKIKRNLLRFPLFGFSNPSSVIVNWQPSASCINLLSLFLIRLSSRSLISPSILLLHSTLCSLGFFPLRGSGMSLPTATSVHRYLQPRASPRLHVRSPPIDPAKEPDEVFEMSAPSGRVRVTNVAGGAVPVHMYAPLVIGKSQTAAA